jgi:DNA polymerase-3 subunit gamma/tau
MAEALPMRVLTRLWQMLLKALEEVTLAPNAMMAAEMAVIRLTHVADLPSPEELVRKLQDMPPLPPPTGGGAVPGAGSGGVEARGSARAPTHAGPSGPSASGAQTVTALAPDALARFATFESVIELIRAHRDVRLLVEVETTLRLVKYRPGRIEFEPTADAAADFAQRLGHRLQAFTGARWAITVVNSGGGDTIAETRDAEELRLKAEAAEHPLVKEVLAHFPKATITAIRSPAEQAAQAGVEALPEVDDEWDPFEED